MTGAFRLCMIILSADLGAQAWFSHGFFGVSLIAVGFYGLRYARRCASRARAIMNTPTTTTAQAQQGSVRVRGTLQSTQPVTSPFSGTVCCCCKVWVEDSGSSGDGIASHPWAPLHSEVSGPPFELRDSTGVLAIDPRGLEIDAPATFRHEVISKPEDAREEAMMEYVRQNCPDRLNSFLLDLTRKAFVTPEQEADPRVQERLRELERRRHRQLHRETKNQSFVFKETCLQPGREVEIVGTVERRGDARFLTKGPGDGPFFLSEHTGQVLDHTQARKARIITLASASALVLGVVVIVFIH